MTQSAKNNSSSSSRKDNVRKIEAASESEPDDIDCEPHEKPTSLLIVPVFLLFLLNFVVLHDNDYVSGSKIFTFQARKKCEVLIQPKTPHSVRNKKKKGLNYID